MKRQQRVRAWWGGRGCQHSATLSASGSSSSRSTKHGAAWQLAIRVKVTLNPNAVLLYARLGDTRCRGRRTVIEACAALRPRRCGPGDKVRRPHDERELVAIGHEASKRSILFVRATIAGFHLRRGQVSHTHTHTRNDVPLFI
jgi:hypothetical protein